MGVDCRLVLLIEEIMEQNWEVEVKQIQRAFKTSLDHEYVALRHLLVNIASKLTFYFNFSH